MSVVAERLPLDAVTTATNLTGATVANLDDDPDSPDADYANCADTSLDVELYVTFPSPGGVELTGPQEFRVLCRKRGTTTNQPTARIELWQGGGLVRAGADTDVTSAVTPIVISFGWDAGEVDDPAQTELKVIGLHATQITLTSCIDIGAVEWNSVAAPDLGGLSLWGVSGHSPRDFSGKSPAAPPTSWPYRAHLRRLAG